MKKQTDLVQKPVVKNILAKQASVKVVLNGGNYELDDATIPFQIGFTDKIADKKPTHILVMDITRNVFKENGRRMDYDSCAERTVFKLEPVHYLQLKKPGEHHLIFILFNLMDDDSLQYFLEKRFTYENALHFSIIEKKKFDFQVGYCEAIVSVPEEFFAKKPETKIKKAIWTWTNSWYQLKPVDECEYRKRKIFAFSLKPLLWIVAFFWRFIIALLATTANFVVRVLGLITGFQPISFFPFFKENWWEFLVLNSVKTVDVMDVTCWFGDVATEEYLDDADEDDWYPYKTCSIFGKRFHAPLTIFGLAVYSLLFLCYASLITNVYPFEDHKISDTLWMFLLSVLISFFIASLALNTAPTFRADEEWKWNRNNSIGKKNFNRLFQFIFFTLSGISFLGLAFSLIGHAQTVEPLNFNFNFSFWEFAIFILKWAAIVLGLFFVFKLLPAWLKGTFKKMRVRKASLKETRKTKKKEWLHTSFNLKTLPKKVNIATAPEPSVFVHKFVIKFWQTKAKVCRPFAKD